MGMNTCKINDGHGLLVIIIMTITFKLMAMDIFVE